MLGRDLLGLNIDRGVDLQTALGDARRVFFFKIFADLFDRIIPGGRFWLRLVICGVGKDDRLGFGGIDLGLRVFIGKYFAI